MFAEATALEEDTWRLMGRGVWPSQETQVATCRDVLGVKVA